MKEETVKIAIIHWTDSAIHGADSITKDDPRLKPMKGISVGHLVKEDEEAVTVAVDWWETGAYRNAETILRRQIDHIQITELEIRPTKTLFWKRWNNERQEGQGTQAQSHG